VHWYDPMGGRWIPLRGIELLGKTVVYGEVVEEITFSGEEDEEDVIIEGVRPVLHVFDVAVLCGQFVGNKDISLR
jgi:hypothetical protein